MNDEVEIVHVDSLSYTTTDDPSLGGHDGIACLSRRNFAGIESLEKVLYLFPLGRLIIGSISSFSY